jgi:hypothetical protein
MYLLRDTVEPLLYCYLYQAADASDVSTSYISTELSSMYFSLDLQAYLKYCGKPNVGQKAPGYDNVLPAQSCRVLLIHGYRAVVGF